MSEAGSASDTSTDVPEDVYVVFTPSGRRGFVPPGTTVLDAARALGVDLDSVCGGRSMCGRCQIQLSEGEFAKFQITSRAEAISPATKSELRYADKRGLKPGRRLGCNAQVLAHCVIDIPPESQVHRQVVRKRAEVRDIEIRPVTHLHYVEVREPDLHDQSSDFRRLCECLREQWPNWGIADDISCDYAVLTTLQKALREGAWKVTVALREGNRVVGVWPGFRERIYGLAVDIGSTTMSGHLCDLATGKVLSSAGTMNPQIRFGEDLMSRVSYVMMNPGGEEEMTRVVREAVNYLATQTAAEIGAGSDEIVDLVFVGNPVMHHLMLGIDPTELGGAPFALTVDTAVELTAAELDLYLHPGARVYALPCIAGHVGADTAAVVLSETPYKNDEITLIVDVGTNAEIVLGNRDHLLACSSPTGPAFEGAQISSGQRAAPGAIERVRIDPATLEPSFQIIGSDRWSDEEGFEESAEEIGGISGICGSGIIEAIGEMFLAGMITTDGVIDRSLAEKSDRIFADGRTFSYRLSETVSVTQTDVRSIQLAKAALYAGARLLMDRRGVDAVDRVVLAGAFGSHIDPKYAMVLGMIPDCDLANVTSVGNAAGTGARIALLNGQARREIEWVVRTIEKVETAVEPRFQEHFVGAMALPHKTDPYARLRAAVKLPEPRSLTGGDGEGGGRRRRRRG
ncbi:ASKHA domain-containing protein [Nisaea acidiphila]|uniref:ASKHA domain-containing protein n=1 Tax=Nisaea acidiphila TaxID=1862145 RepID=A0A9J7APG2_9PROT|nr:ASKHA domain-containing protein [Nisaea acidiphila]UUX48810.1 ASKHA domain-containing protein [Nisaea acidiphila]